MPWALGLTSPTSQARQQCQADPEGEAEAVQAKARVSEDQSRIQEDVVKVVAGARAEAAAKVEARDDVLVPLQPELAKEKAEARTEAKATEARVVVRAGSHPGEKAKSRASFMHRADAPRARRASSSTISPISLACCIPRENVPMETSADTVTTRLPRQLHLGRTVRQGRRGASPRLRQGVRRFAQHARVPRSAPPALRSVQQQQAPGQSDSRIQASGEGAAHGSVTLVAPMT